MLKKALLWRLLRGKSFSKPHVVIPLNKRQKLALISGITRLARIGMGFILAGLLTTCQTGTPLISSPPSRLTQAVIPPTAITLTQRPTQTITLTPTVTPRPTLTQTSTVSPTPTEDLSFFTVADCLPTDTAFQRGTVIEIIDGDTIKLQFSDDNTTTVRYIGIDAPENGLPFSDAARLANSDLVLRKEVVLVRDQSDMDTFGRLLRYVIVDNLLVNQELVRTGYARAVNYPPDESCKDVIARAEQEAKLASAGLWAATPTPEPFAGQVIILTVNKREEWVDIQNVGDYAVDLVGWDLLSERGGQNCPLSGVLPAGQVLRIWAMANQGPGYSCGYSSPIWNNSQSDPAVLYNDQGVEVSRK